MFRNLRDRRRQFRLDFHIPMRYRKIETNSQEFKGSLMKDISEGGAKMTIHEFLPLNSRLAMQIPLMPGRKSVEGVSRIAWLKKAAFGEQYDAGLEFINLNQGDHLHIAKFIFNKSVEKVL
ncbi:MAG: PilZ domain-containing protein [Candidatus Omnitrophica bacterium]|nr:PilZ domain-containing protein [Candidatus Omnitrophota bacterium]